jgi:crossover junction endodeoxyribonuclease RusA
MRIEVYGSPAGQGSKRYVGNGLMIESSKKVKPFREAVKWAVLEAKPYDGFMFHGPVAVMMTFTMKKSKSAPKTRTTYADRAPDLDKMLRAAFDACTQSGIWEDDARVVLCLCAKVFPNEGRDSLPSPGVVIRIEHYAGAVPEDWNLSTLTPVAPQ